ncbi:MAG TPA: DUF6600 domain-containing protein [Terriglobales bacterium]|nr:DUF6600 domain-containing protein [Terriglobales bacterium]
MNISRRFASIILVTLFPLLFLNLAMADGDDDPPGRAVDIRYISGQVSVQPGGVNDWVEAVVNRPLTSADRVWTDKDSRTELHLGTSAMRMNSETSLTLTNVSDQTVQVELDQGTLNLWVRRLYDGEVYEVDTPNMAFTITRAGEYRFDVDPNGDTTYVTVRRGEGEATGQGNGVQVRSGEVATFTNGTSMQHEISNASAPDGFDDWCRVRNERAGHSESARYVSPDVIGAEDLDQYGSWRQTPDYGAVWVPSGVGPGWAPYHDGHWVWVEPWGWTWVDDAPWGFAPCHYGRWVYAGGYWGWSPGPVVMVARPVYAPALVAFVGGAHWGVGVGSGVGVGWFPLGYNEPYVPPYRVSRNYYNNVNITNTHITNVTVINNYYNNTTVVNNIHYANRTAPGGFTAVPASTMASSQSVRRAALNVPPAEVARAQVGTAAAVAPSRNAVLGLHAGAHAAVPPAQAVSRQVVTKTAPPPRPIPFEAKQAALEKNPGHPLDVQTRQQIRATLPPPPPRQQNVQNANPPGAPNGQGAPNSNRPGAIAPNANTPNANNPNGNNRPGNNPDANPGPARNGGAPNAGTPSNVGPGRNVPRPPSAGGNPNTARPDRNNPPGANNPGMNNSGAPNRPGANNPAPNNNRPGAMNEPAPSTNPNHAEANQPDRNSAGAAGTPNAGPARNVPRPPSAGGNQNASRPDGNNQPANNPQQGNRPGARNQTVPDNNPGRPAPQPPSRNQTTPGGYQPGSNRPDNTQRDTAPRNVPPPQDNRAQPPANRQEHPTPPPDRGANIQREAPRESAPRQAAPREAPRESAPAPRQAAPHESTPRPPQKEEPSKKNEDHKGKEH